MKEDFDASDLLEASEEPYFVPSGTPLHQQLFNFKKAKSRIALVVDEYGDIEGIVTLEDILEEIVGEFTTDVASDITEIHPQDDGSYVIEGAALLRDINRALSWSLPMDGPRTAERASPGAPGVHPESNVCMRIGDYLIETLQVTDNGVRGAKVRRAQTPGDPSGGR